MKGIALSKSWDDVFPDNHSLEFPVPKASDGHSFDFDGQATPARHWRSSSVAEEDTPTRWDVSPQAFRNLKEDFKRMRKGTDRKKKHSNTDRLITLEEDVAHLQRKFQDERAVREILEQALGRASSVVIPAHTSFAPQQTQELIREIALMELEVAHLEQHLLSLYRTAFEQHPNRFFSNPKAHDMCISPNLQDRHLQQRVVSKVVGKQMVPRNNYFPSGSLDDANCDTAFDNHMSFESEARQSTSKRSSLKKDRGLRSYYSQPVSLAQETQQTHLQVDRDEEQDMYFVESRKSTPCRDSYSENLTGSLSPLLGEGMYETPNKLSEDLVRCMAAIYCKLAEPPLPHLGGLTSPASSSSSASTFSQQRLSSDGWSSQCKTDVSCDVSSNDQFQRNCTAEIMGACSSTVEVQWICVDNDRLTYAARMLRNFRSLVQQLERVDPGQMKHEQKLAFWINIHNALMMHAYLAYGIPRNQLKRVSLLQKAAYKVGAHSINAHTIEQSILGCRSHRPAKWLQTFLSPTVKLRGDERQAYAIDRPEPQVCFALCCGGRSDPTVRVYTERNIYQELDVAKRQFLQANVGFRKDSRILLPRILESFAKESSVGSSCLLDWVCQNVPEKLASSVRNCMHAKAHKCIEWLPYDFTFKYVFVCDLARWFPPCAA